ncbi:MAG: phosphoenolpyruvate--protein phosphotransferase [Betaproteobacteria bacterium]|nr:phosphoenolpyruvate--protein phosphotransferase [Betaproteobacteria bacterium]
MSFTLHGVGVSPGIAIGVARLASHTRIEVAHYVLSSQFLDKEIARFDDAIAAVRNEMEQLRGQIPSNAPAELPAFLDMHQMILNDSMLSEVPKQLIRSQQCNAEWALTQQMEHLLAQFDAIDDAYLRERKADVVQVVERVLKVLLGHPDNLPSTESNLADCILVAHDLSPADMIGFKHQRFAAFITDVGGATSHTAILARSLNISSVMALHNAHGLIRDNEIIIVDGEQGVVIVDPDDAELEEYQLRQTQWVIEHQKLKRLSGSRSATLDGLDIELHANIELPRDVAAAKEAGASGIGLFRSEFLFMNRSGWPDEEEQFEAYREVAQAMGDMPVTIRTLDVGADKPLGGLTEVTLNPALGKRAIRLCLSESAMFHTQLRAILRASHYGRIKIMIPMLCNLQELRLTHAAIARAKASLVEENLPFDPGIEVGGMIEVPAAALMAQSFAERLDFLSIGTNDLIQYTLAIDRADDGVAYLYDPMHPAVLQLLSVTLRAGEKAGKPVSVCGEMAGDPRLTRLLLGLGLRRFSMQSASLLSVKQQILKSDMQKIVLLVQKILRTTDEDKLETLIARLNQ